MNLDLVLGGGLTALNRATMINNMTTVAGKTPGFSPSSASRVLLCSPSQNRE